MTPLRPTGETRLDLLTVLVHELLDAHQDTIDLAEGVGGPLWRAQLDYLRALQRTGREVLALAHQAEPTLNGGRSPSEA